MRRGVHAEAYCPGDCAPYGNTYIHEIFKQLYLRPWEQRKQYSSLEIWHLKSSDRKQKRENVPSSTRFEYKVVSPLMLLNTAFQSMTKQWSQKWITANNNNNR